MRIHLDHGSSGSSAPDASVSERVQAVAALANVKERATVHWDDARSPELKKRRVDFFAPRFDEVIVLSA